MSGRQAFAGSRVRRVEPGVYEILGSRDGDGKPYWVERSGSVQFPWQVRDSRNRVVSDHRTKNDAVLCVEVEEVETHVGNDEAFVECCSQWVNRDDAFRTDDDKWVCASDAGCNAGGPR